MTDTKERLRPYVRGSLVGLAVGDALGMPVETMTHDEIMAVTGGRGITDYVAPIQTRFKTQRKLKPGQWTDDTQLSFAVARSLIRSKGFDLEDQARAHVEALAETVSGWGKTTRLAIEQIRDGVRKAGDPPPQGPKIGSGNGVAMKIAPLVWFHALRMFARVGFYPVFNAVGHDFEKDVFLLGRLTHSHLKASLGALLVGYTIVSAIDASVCARDMRGNMLGLLPKISLAEYVDEIQRGVIGTERSFRDTLPRALARKISESDLRSITGMKFHVVDTVCYTLGVANRHPYEFERAICEAVNGGGDADTNAAMVGAIVGARVGIDGIPKRWLDGLLKKDEIIAVADELLETALS